MRCDRITRPAREPLYPFKDDAGTTGNRKGRGWNPSVVGILLLIGDIRPLLMYLAADFDTLVLVSFSLFLGVPT